MKLCDLVGMNYARLVNGDLYDFYVLSKKTGETYKHYNILRKSVEITPSFKEFCFLKKVGLCCALVDKNRKIIKVWGSSSEEERFTRLNVRSDHDQILNVGV